jgi:hypothetical protein
MSLMNEWLIIAKIIICIDGKIQRYLHDLSTDVGVLGVRCAGLVLP